jgi:hypothetical protein
MNSGALITRNEATSAAGGPGGGGGVYMAQTGTGRESIFLMEGNAKITENRCAQSAGAYALGGGGVYLAGGDFKMYDTATIALNDTLGQHTNMGVANGAGVRISGGHLYMYDDSKITQNKALNNKSMGSSFAALAQGGGVFIAANSSFEMNDNATVSENVVADIRRGEGGGVYVAAATSVFTMNDNSIIENNQALTFFSQTYLDEPTSPDPLDSRGSAVYLATGAELILNDNARIPAATLTAISGILPSGYEQTIPTKNDTTNSVCVFVNFNSNSGKIGIGNNFNYGDPITVDIAGFNLSSASTYISIDTLKDINDAHRTILIDESGETTVRCLPRFVLGKFYSHKTTVSGVAIPPSKPLSDYEISSAGIIVNK